jgi:hypothetical protein
MNMVLKQHKFGKTSFHTSSFENGLNKFQSTTTYKTFKVVLPKLGLLNEKQNPNKTNLGSNSSFKFNHSLNSILDFKYQFDSRVNPLILNSQLGYFKTLIRTTNSHMPR